jgi:hypothetical protein
MKLTRAQIESMQEDMTSDVLEYLTNYQNLSIEDAMTLFYNSDTFARLQDAKSGLYYQSVGYVLDCLNNELTIGKCW